MNSNGFKVENASLMFESCVGLKQANINWKNIFSTVNNIEAMF